MGWRSVFGIVAGVVTGFVFVMLMEMAGQVLFPAPPDVASIDALPMGTKLAVIVGYAIASLAGGAVAAWVGRNSVPAFAVGGVLLGAGLWNMFSLPHPVWMIVTSAIVLFVPAIVAGYIVTKRIPPPPQPAQAELPLQH